MPRAAAPAPAEDKPQELGAGGSERETTQTPKDEGPLEEMTSLRDPTAVSGAGKIPEHFYAWFWGLAASSALLLLFYFWRMDGEQLEILKELCASVVPLGVLTFVVLAVILFGISTATESAAIGALGAMYLAVMAKYLRQGLGWSLVGFIMGNALGRCRGEDWASLVVAGSIGGGAVGPPAARRWDLTALAGLPPELKKAGLPSPQTNGRGCLVFV